MSTISSEKIQSLADLIAGSGRITIATHTRPDGDAMGSSTAMKSYLEACFGKEARIVIANAYSESIAFILGDQGQKECLQYDIDKEATDAWIGSSDLIICLDCNGFSRTDELCAPLTDSKAKKVLIDHHLAPQEELFDLCFSETEISSASELLFWVLMEMPGIGGDAEKLPALARTALMSGMTTDTNNFANSVVPSTLQMASKLLAAGVDRDWILENLYNRYRENRLRLIGYLLDSKMTIMDNGTAYTIVTNEEQQRFDMRDGELEGYVNMPLGMDKVRMSIFLKEDNGYFRVSIRSKKGTSANSCSKRYFNGGGHEQAAGGRLYIPRDIAESSLVEEYVRKVTDEFFGQ